MKVAVVTGASSGIGFALSKRLYNNGIKVYGISNIDFSHDCMTHYKGDVTNDAEIATIIEKIYEEAGRIDYLVNNAGMGISGSIEATDVAMAKKMFDVNFHGVFILSKTVLPYMRKQNSGRIVSLGSVASEFAIPFQAFYSSSKAALKVFSEALNNEVYPYGIRVTTILPGDAKTNFTKNRVKNKNELPVYEKRVEKSIQLMEKDEMNGMSVEYVSKKIYKVLLKKNPPVQRTVGNQYKVFLFIKRFLPTKMINKLVGKIYAFKKIK